MVVFNLTNDEKTILCKVFHDLKVHDGDGSNIIKNLKLKEMKFTSLKSYDCHMIMQQLLSIVLHQSTKPKVTSILIDMCNYFNDIYSKTINVEHVEKLEKEIIITLCNGKTFSTKFFYNNDASCHPSY